jgi:hypothetical protein
MCINLASPGSKLLADEAVAAVADLEAAAAVVDMEVEASVSSRGLPGEFHPDHLKAEEIFELVFLTATIVLKCKCIVA